MCVGACQWLRVCADVPRVCVVYGSPWQVDSPVCLDSLPQIRMIFASLCRSNLTHFDLTPCCSSQYDGVVQASLRCVVTPGGALFWALFQENPFEVN